MTDSNASTSNGKTKLVPAPVPLDLSARRTITISFWAVVLLLGVPVWSYTTNIERRPLPVAEVAKWSNARECPLRPTINLRVRTEEAEMWGNDSEIGVVVTRRLSQLPTARCLDFRIRMSGAEPIESGEYTIEVATSGESFRSERTAKAIVALGQSSVENTVYEAARSLLGLDAAPSDPRVVKFASRYKLAFTLLNQDSSTGGALLQWDIQRLISTRLQPLLTSLAPLHSFIIESQIQYFAPLSIDLKKDEEGNTLVEEDDLRAFVNSADWNLASSVTMDTTLHFLLYVPSVENRPMRIRTASGSLDSSNAFITPQWGGVVIHNPSSSDSDSASDSDALDSSFLLFAQQFRKLLGVSELGHDGPLSQWQVDALVRKRLTEATKESVETLQAIVNLAGEIPNMRIGKEVQRGVRLSLNELEEARNTVQLAPDVALRHAAAALELASKAYFNPTMLALLYFPDEHKYAVYTPLFGPIAVPMVVALLKEVKEWKEKRRKQKEAKSKVE